MLMDDKLASALHRINPGDILTFGLYPQAANGADRTPIKWRVLQDSGSEYILDCKRYHTEDADITWRDCDLRKWLNDEFYNAAFNAIEKEIIKTTRCTDTDDTTIRRRTIGTAFARAKKTDGCHLYVYDKGVEKDYLIEDGQKHGCSWWWLRTQGTSPSRAFFVGTHSSIRSYCRVNRVNYGVRPALKLNLP
jgi:hypothetical protein